MKRTFKILSLLMVLTLVFAMSSGMASALEVIELVPAAGAEPAAPAEPETFVEAAPAAPSAPSVSAPSVSGGSSDPSCKHPNWTTPVYKEQADGSWIASRTCMNCYISQSSVGEIKEEIVKQPTCTESGLKVYTAVFPAEWAGKFKVHEEAIPALGHSIDPEKFVWVGDENNHYNVCDRCGEKSNPQPHVWGEWQVLKQPTSQSVGKAIQYCTVCGCNRTCELARKTPQTGDDAMLGLWLGLAMISAIGAGSIAVRKIKNK